MLVYIYAMAQTISNRMVVLLNGLLASILLLPLPDAAPFHQPSDAEFLGAVSDFWYHSLWSAKHLRRGELCGGPRPAATGV